MAKALVILGVLIMLFNCCGINKEALAENNDSDIYSEKKYIFPMDWVGNYEGQLLIFDESADSSFIKMKLSIGYPDASGFYPWTITYGENDIRSYGLEAVNPEVGHYRIDEFNSIKVDAYLKGNHLISKFHIKNTDIMIDYEKVSNGINVHLYITQTNNYNESGGEIIGSSTVPMVASFPLNVFQKAYLKKQD